MLPNSKYFTEHSYGLRHNKGCHAALNNIKAWVLCKWLISSDIKRCLDTINQNKLISIIQESIEDQTLMCICNTFFNLQVKGFKANDLN